MKIIYLRSQEISYDKFVHKNFVGMFGSEVHFLKNSYIFKFFKEYLILLEKKMISSLMHIPNNNDMHYLQLVLCCNV